MNNLIISTEATSDLPQEILDKYNIKVNSVNYFVDGKPYNGMLFTVDGKISEYKDGEQI